MMRQLAQNELDIIAGGSDSSSVYPQEYLVKKL